MKNSCHSIDDRFRRSAQISGFLSTLRKGSELTCRKQRLATAQGFNGSLLLCITGAICQHSGPSLLVTRLQGDTMAMLQLRYRYEVAMRDRPTFRRLGVCGDNAADQSNTLIPQANDPISSGDVRCLQCREINRPYWQRIEVCSCVVKIFHDSATLPVTVDLVSWRIRMRAPCSAMPSAARLR